MKVYFVRHGETTYNARRVFQPLDSPLSEKGEAQAKFLAQRLKNLSIDIILSSPLLRTRQTTAYIEEHVPKPVVWVDELMELKRASEFINKNGDSDEVKDIQKLQLKNQNDPNWHYSDEENFFDLRKKAIKLVEILEKRKEENILAVTHGEVLRMIIGVMFLGESITVDEYNGLQKFLMTINTGLTICVKENNRWRMLTWNDHAHLGEV